MRIILPALGAAFAATFIWLTVRIVNRRERWANWLALVLLAYPLSFGPACWITSRLNYGASSIPFIYRPICATLFYAPVPITETIRWYAKALAADRWSLGTVDVDEWMWSQDPPFDGVTYPILH